MAETPDYKATLNLPKTAFPMKGNLPQNEPKTIERWTKNKTYEGMVSRSEKRPQFVMPDGPPYANGNLHVGHVLNKVLKDIVIKYKNMSGFDAAFVPGWDCHGLPIELNVTKKLGSKKASMSDREIRDLCRKEAMKWVEKQKEQFIRLGVLADWDKPYLTLQPEYEAQETRVLAEILDNGILYRGEKPVYWCPALQTALAAAEVEYHDHTSLSVFVKFYVEAEASLDAVGVNDKPLAFVIWTTTPWTLPANYGICLNERLEYGVYDTGSEYLVLADELAEEVEKQVNAYAEKKGRSAVSFTKVKSLKGSAFENIKAKHPFMDRESLVILGDHVTAESGTGCVHTAPGHGMDDYVVGLKYGLPVVSPVDKAGRYTNDVPQWEGEKIWDANPKIAEHLDESGHLIGLTKLTHSYPHNPRSKTPLIFRATPQWFIRMDDKNFPLREKALEAAEKDIEFFPGWGSQRLNSMLSHAPDWCLSRQRTWGVPIPVFFCKNCGEALLDKEVILKVANKMESSGEGIEAYYSEDPSTYTSGKDCGKCGHTEFERSQDILDVWFDSGVCHTAVQKQREGMAFPADIYLEGSDQHRGWFLTSLLSSIAAYGEPPYKALITHGFVNDAEGHKMSKSKGNVVDPADVIKRSGAEILRLWVAYEDYGQDVNISNEMFQRVTETYRRIRNTMRFLLGNLNDFDPGKDAVSFKDMPDLDQWALMRLNQLTEKCTEAYESYDFYKVYHALNAFFTVDLSSVYLDVLKDRLYTWKPDGLERRSSQTVLFELLNSLTGLMAPILSFLAEEVYEYLPGEGKKESVFATNFPKTNPDWQKAGLLEKFEELIEVRSEVSKVLEELRRNKEIGSSLDAKVVLSAEGQRLEALKSFEPNLREFLIVSQFELKSGAFKVEAGKAEGEKCVRCWHYSTETGKVDKWPEVCPKCVEALS